MIADVEAMTPKTPEDKLFKGSAIAGDYLTEGLRLIDEAQAERPSTLGHVLRADARLICAQETGTVAAAEDAVASAELAKKLIPDNPKRLGRSAAARLAAAIAYERIGDPAKAAEHLAVARREVQELARFSTNPDVVLLRFEAAMVFVGVDGRLDRTAEEPRRNNLFECVPYTSPRRKREGRFFPRLRFGLVY
jgi:hypothetical protein